MIDLSGYTAKSIERAMLSQVPDNIDTREGSMIQTAVGPVAWYLEGLYLLLKQMQENAYADTAVGQFLDLIVQERGLRRKRAVPAVRRGTFDVAVASGSRFKTMNGADSVIFVTGELLSSADNVYSYAMTCQTPGAIGNSYVGNLLPVTAVPNLKTAVLGEIIMAGTEEETDGALKKRYFETFQVMAFGGNIPSYRNEILSIPGVGAVQVYPVWNGGGTVLCSILDDELKPALPAMVEQVQNRICPPENGETDPSENGYGVAPIGAAVTVTTATPLVLDISCDIAFIAGISDGEKNYQHEIEQKIQEYLYSVKESWGKPLKGYKIDYSVTVYISRIIYSVLTIPQIANVTHVRINGSENDLSLTETAKLQQIPVLGEVSVNGG
jgi:uncharacterized phage protein gp47/JayE